MNRKLINGLLLLTVATGGIGTFTSCKDDNYVDPIENKEVLADLVKLIDAELAKKQDKGNYASAAELEALKSDIAALQTAKSKVEALAGAGLLTTENQKFLMDLIQNNENYAKGLKTYVDDMIMNMITSVEIQEVYNPAFGTINLPLGIQSTLLANYYYKADHSVNFPQLESTAIVYGDKSAQEDLDDYLVNNPVKGEAFKAGVEVQPIDRLGEIYVTINPSNIPAEAIDGLAIKLETSNGKQMLSQSGTLKAVKDDDHLINFGITRAGNGFYRIDVSASAEDVPSINLNLDEQLKATAKDFFKSPSKSDLANLAEAIYRQFNNRIPALALSFTSSVPTSFTYESTPWNKVPGGVVINADGTVNKGDAEPGDKENVDSNEPNPILRSIYTRYAIGAVTYHPLSFSFDPEGYVPDRRLPQIGHIQEYVSKVLDKVSFDLNLGINPDDYNFSFNLENVNFEVKPDAIEINLGGTPVYDVKDPAKIIGVLSDEANITLEYDGDKVSNPDYATALNPLVNAIVNAVNGEGGFKDQIQSAVQSQLISQVDKLVGDLNDQLKSVNTQISDKIQNIKDEINNELNGRVGDGVNRLIDLYNALAKKINNVLDDPNAYMQVYAAYRDGNGDLHHFSNVETDPSVFTPGTGNTITMFLTSYNGELLAPAYKKYVAVVKDLTDGSSVSEINKNAEFLNTVLEGRQQKVYIPVGGNNGLKAGHTYQVVYTALDYRGNVSARNFYVRIAK